MGSKIILNYYNKLQVLHMPIKYESEICKHVFVSYIMRWLCHKMVTTLITSLMCYHNDYNVLS